MECVEFVDGFPYLLTCVFERSLSLSITQLKVCGLKAVVRKEPKGAKRGGRFTDGGGRGGKWGLSGMRGSRYDVVQVIQQNTRAESRGSWLPVDGGDRLG